MEPSNQELERYLNLSLCNQKDGVGKLTFIALFIGFQYDTLKRYIIVNCDYFSV